MSEYRDIVLAAISAGTMVELYAEQQATIEEQQATIAKLKRFVLDQLCECHDEYGRRAARPCERCRLWYEYETWEQFDKAATQREGK